jgi:hypothetical protein
MPVGECSPDDGLMYWPPDSQLKLIGQRDRQLFDLAERVRLLEGPSPIPMRAGRRAALIAFLKGARLTMASRGVRKDGATYD